jgi:hypothetical protein
MDDFLPSRAPTSDSTAPDGHKLVPGDNAEQQAALEFGHGQV